MSLPRKSMAHSRPLLIQVITPYQDNKSDNYVSVEDLLKTLCDPVLGAKTLVRTDQKRLYLVSLTPIEEHTLPNFYDGINEATKHLAADSNGSSLIFQFSVSRQLKTQSDTEKSYLMVISKYDQPIPASYEDEFEDLGDFNEKSQEKYRLMSWISSRFQPKYTPLHASGEKRPFKKHLTTWILISITAFAIVISASYYLNNINRLPGEPWIRYPTPRSEGPRYQLEFNHRNVSSWAAENPSASDEYYIRVDDGCMFAPHLVNEQELRYQKLLETRYPQLHDLRMQRKYLNEEFLSDPFAIQIKVDNAFHLGHCVLALRRYWWARETGKHVCPKDLDFRHIRHCLDVFDSWVFPDEFPQHKHTTRNAVPEIEANKTASDASDGWDMSKPAWFVWKQEVCF